MRAFFAELEALEVVANVLAEAVALDAERFELVNQLTTEDGRLFADGIGFLAAGILIVRAVAKEEIRHALGGVDRLVRLDAVLFAVTLEQIENAVGQTSGMRQIERDVEVRHTRRSVYSEGRCSSPS